MNKGKGTRWCKFQKKKQQQQANKQTKTNQIRTKTNKAISGMIFNKHPVTQMRTVSECNMHQKVTLPLPATPMRRINNWVEQITILIF